jgi:hypothetical protein
MRAVFAALWLLISIVSANAWTHGSAGSGALVFADMPVGAGGYLRGNDIQYDGTHAESILTRADTYGAYEWSASQAQWIQLVTPSSMPAGYSAVDMENGVFDIRAAPSNTNVGYMLYDGYVFSTSNLASPASVTWTQTSYPQCSANESNNTVAQNGPWMAIDPINPSVVYVGCISGGVEVSANGGSSWSAVSGITTPNANGAAILFDTSGGSTGGKTNNIYIVDAGTGVYKSTNAGTSFSLTSGGPTNFTNAKVANGDLLVCPNDGASDFVYYNGTSWATVSTAGLGQCQDIAVNPNNSNEVIAFYVGGNTSVSTTGVAGTQSGSQGSPWTFTATDIPWLAWAQNAYTYVQIGQAKFDLVTSNLMNVTGGIGTWSLTPTWSPTSINNYASMSVGVEQLVTNRLRPIPGGPPLYLADDRPIFYLGSYTTYPSIYGPGIQSAEGPINHGYDAAYEPGNAAYICGIFENTAELSGCSTNGGQTWSKFVSFPGGGFSGTGEQGGSIAIDTAGNIVWAPCNTYPYVSQNGGASWTGLTALGSSGWSFADYLRRFVVTADKVSATTFYAFNSNTGIWKSTNGGTSWTNVNATTFDAGAIYNGILEASPTQAGYLWWTSGPQTPGPHPVGQSFYISTNAGTTWSTVPNVQEVRAFGFGAPKPGNTNPSMYIVGWVSSVYGIWESDNATLGGTPTWNFVTDWGYGSLDNPVEIAGNPNIYGEFFIGLSGSGARVGRLPAYVAKPVVANQSANVTSSSAATISFNTTEAATCTINYGTTTSYGSTANCAGSSTSQSVNLAGLSNYTTYHYDIAATDANSQTFTSYDQSFTTFNTVAPNAPTSVSASNVNNYSNTVTWTSNQGSDPQPISGNNIYRSTGGAYTLIGTAGAVTTYTDLSASPSTTYTYKISSFDASGNTSAESSASNSVTTTAGSSFALTAQPATAVVGYTSSTATFSGVSFGSAVSGRSVCAVFFLNANTAATSATEAGNSMTEVASDGGSPAKVSTWCASDATNTSGTIVVNVSGPNNINDVMMSVFALTDSATQSTNPAGIPYGFNPDPQVQSPTIPSSGTALSCLGAYNTNAATFSGGGFNLVFAQQIDSTHGLTLACAASYTSGSQTLDITGFSSSGAAAQTDVRAP